MKANNKRKSPVGVEILGENPTERKKRLDRERDAAKRNNETMDQRNVRLEIRRRLDIERRQHETIQQRERRLRGMNESTRKRRVIDASREEVRLAADILLAKTFEDKMKELKFSLCSICSKSELKFVQQDSCTKCSRSQEVNIFSEENNMNPGDVPDELRNLTALEEILIAKVHPVISVYRTKGSQMHYSGHVINFPQNVKTFSKNLPNIEAALNSVIVVRKKGNESHDHVDFRVSGSRIKKALKWLKQNNEYYQDICVDEEAINKLPVDGSLFNSLPVIETQKDLEELDGVERTGVPFIPIENQEKQIGNILGNKAPVIQWPAIENSPIDEFRTAGYIASAFPALFPYGKADLRQGRLKKVGELEYFKFLMTFGEGRFASHARFPFFALNTTLRWTALTQGKVFVKRNLSGKTFGDLKTLLDYDKNLTNKVMVFGSSIRGTKAYWFKRCGELLAMVEQIGTPTIFFTLSAADLHWPDLFRLLKPGAVDSDQISNSERQKLMSENPFIVATFFEERGRLFIDTVMKKKFDVVDFWYRFEWQHRGSPHIHGLLWINGAPNVDMILDKSPEVQKSIVDYFDNLASTWNPNKTLSPLNVHPCQLRLGDIGSSEEDQVDDYTRLLNKVQRHTKCSESYCLRKKKGGSKLECRFKFPIEEREETELVVDHTGNPRLMTKRNDDRLNVHNPFVTKLWRANTDFQPIMSRQAVINYIAKYASKSEPQSESYKQLMSNIIDEGNSEEPARKAIQKLLMKTVAERDYSAQEVAHTLMGYPLYHSSRQFVNLTVKRDDWIPIQKEGDDVDPGVTFIDKYRMREDKYNGESLLNFASKYYFKGTKLTLRRKLAIVQVYPKLKLNTESTTLQREEFFRQKVLLYLCWTDEEEIRGSYDTWEECYKQNNLGVLCENIDLEDAEDDEFEEVEPVESIEEMEEFMIAARDRPNGGIDAVELGNREIDLNYDWSATFAKYDCEELLTLLADAKKEDEESNTYEYPNVVLTKEQNEVMELLEQQIQSLKNSTTPIIRSTIIQGKGGSGKSTVIRAMTARLAEELGSDTFRLMAPTGCAASNISGTTIHSSLSIGVSGEMQGLEGESLRAFQNNMKNVKFMIFDEYSMIGSRLLGKVDKRCREGNPEHSEEMFGDVNTYFLGDIKQLPPVMDSAPYQKRPISGIGANGRLAYQSIKKCIMLGDSQRQAGNGDEQTYFRDLLDRLSFGKSTKEDWLKLNSRCSSKIPNFQKEYKDALRLFPTNDLTREYNKQKLVELNQPIARLTAKHNCAEAKSGSSDIAQGLCKELLLCIGARVMLRNNIWTSKGLVNGAMGVIRDIVFRPGENPSSGHPVAVLVQWDNYSGRTIEGELFPVLPVTRYWSEKGKSCSRTQFPIVLAWAVTIHKSQGMTLENAVVDIGDNEFSVGLTYVALSRMKSIGGIAFDPPFCFERLEKIGKSSLLKERLIEEARLRTLH